MYKEIMLKKIVLFCAKISTDLKDRIKEKLEAELRSHMEKLKGTSMISATHEKIANKQSSPVINGLVVIGGIGMCGTFYIRVY